MRPKCGDDGSCKGDDEKDAWRVLTHLVAANQSGAIVSWFDLPKLRFGRVEGVGFDTQVGFQGFMLRLR